MGWCGEILQNIPDWQARTYFGNQLCIPRRVPFHYAFYVYPSSVSDYSTRELVWYLCRCLALQRFYLILLYLCVNNTCQVLFFPTRPHGNERGGLPIGLWQGKKIWQRKQDREHHEWGCYPWRGRIRNKQIRSTSENSHTCYGPCIGQDFCLSYFLFFSFSLSIFFLLATLTFASSSTPTSIIRLHRQSPFPSLHLTHISTSWSFHPFNILPSSTFSFSVHCSPSPRSVNYPPACLYVLYLTTTEHPKLGEDQLHLQHPNTHSTLITAKHIIASTLCPSASSYPCPPRGN